MLTVCTCSGVARSGDTRSGKFLCKTYFSHIVTSLIDDTDDTLRAGKGWAPRTARTHCTRHTQVPAVEFSNFLH